MDPSSDFLLNKPGMEMRRRVDQSLHTPERSRLSAGCSVCTPGEDVGVLRQDWHSLFPFVSECGSDPRITRVLVPRCFEPAWVGEDG